MNLTFHSAILQELFPSIKYGWILSNFCSLFPVALRFHHPVLKGSALSRLSKLHFEFKRTFISGLHKVNPQETHSSVSRLLVFNLWACTKKKSNSPLECPVSILLSCHLLVGKEKTLHLSGSIFRNVKQLFFNFQKWLPPSPFSDENPQREGPAWCPEALKCQHSIGIRRDHTGPAWSLASSLSSTIFPLLCFQCGAKWGSSKVLLSFFTPGKHTWQEMENEWKWLLITSRKQQC